MYDPEKVQSAMQTLKEYLNTHSLKEKESYEFKIRFNKFSDTEYLFNWPEVIKWDNKNA